MTSSKRAGFTLIEVVLVLAIVGILTAVVVPAFVRGTRHDVLEDGASELRRVAMRARNTAIERGEQVTLIIDPASARFWLSAPDTSGTLALPAGVALWSAKPRARLAFDPEGLVVADPIAVREGQRVVPFALDPWTGEGGVDAP